jgi:hypothetical protein
MSPTKVIERTNPLPTMIDEGTVDLKGWKVVKLLAYEVVCLEAAESATQSMTMGGVTIMVLKELVKDCWSQVLNNGDQGWHVAFYGGAWRGGTKCDEYGGPPRDWRAQMQPRMPAVGVTAAEEVAVWATWRCRPSTGCHTRFLRPKPDAHRMYAQDQVVIHTVRM